MFDRFFLGYITLSRKVIKQMEGAKTFHTFNRALDAVYDFCDDNRIWLGFGRFTRFTKR